MGLEGLNTKSMSLSEQFNIEYVGDTGFLSAISRDIVGGFTS